jgi:hypothetical protein
LMVSGFLGTLISLERAVAVAAALKPWGRLAYLAPLVTGVSGALLVLGLGPLGRTLLVLGSLGLVLIFAVIVRLRPDPAHITMGVGAVLWLAGNALWWRGGFIYPVVAWWAGFFVLTIAGERLELARVLLLKRYALTTFAVSLIVFVGGLVVSLMQLTWGVRIAGGGLVLIGAWLLRYDLARRTIRATGLTRYIAACLLPGYAWLIVAGALWVWRAEWLISGPWYDALLHSLFLGFVFSMIFGHAPIILPAVTGIALPYRSALYAPLALLHASLILRIVGDLAAAPPLRQWGGLLNVIAVLLFFGLAAGSALTARFQRPAPR